MKITKHAIERAKERAGLNERSVERIAAKALENGIKHSDTSGKLKKFLDALYLSQGKANNIRIYQEKVFLFHDEILMTVIRLPNDYKKIVNKMKARNV